MDFSFGEILEPTSRAFYDDYDASVPESMELLQLKWLDNECEKRILSSQISRFIVLEGNNSLNIIQGPVLKNKKPICQIEKHRVELYELNNATLVVVSEEINLNLFATITELFKTLLDKADEVVVFSIQSLADYKQTEKAENFVIRGINSKLPDIPALEVPNFITGVSAGVATYRKVIQKSYSAYICYVSLLDIIAIKSILVFLDKLMLPVDFDYKIKALNNKGDLYM